MILDESEDRVDTFLHLALAGEPRAATQFGLDLIDAGVPEANVIGDVLARSQREVGDRWQRNELSVADEHLASGVTESTLSAFSSIPAEATEGYSVLVACSEGDWHSIAAHMIAQQLRSKGFAVTYLGASTPAEDVSRFLERRRLNALVVSCNLPIFFSGVTSLVNAAHRHGVPVLVGGRAFDGDALRASILGADAYATNVAEAVTVLRAWRDRPPTISCAPVVVREGALRLAAKSKELTDVAYDELWQRFPSMSQYANDRLERTRENLAHIVQFLAAAELVDDDGVFLEFLDWLDAVLEARSVPRSALRVELESLVVPLLACDEWAHRLASIGLDHLSSEREMAETLHSGC